MLKLRLTFNADSEKRTPLFPIMPTGQPYKRPKPAIEIIRMI